MAKGPHRIPQRTEGKLSAEEFGRRVQMGSLAPCDRFGIPLKKGSAVLYDPPETIVFQVMDIAPVLDTHFPAGTVRLVLWAQIPMHVQVGGRISGMVKYGQVAETGAIAPDHGELPGGGQVAITDAETQTGESTDATGSHEGSPGGPQPADAGGPVDADPSAEPPPGDPERP